MKRIFIFLILITAVNIAAFSQEISFTQSAVYMGYQSLMKATAGETLSSAEFANYNYYAGFIIGIASMGATMGTYKSFEGVAPDTIIDCVTKYIPKHPELWRYGSFMVVYCALLEGFPAK